MRRVILALLCLLACESTSPPQEDPCPAQCVVHWTTRYWQVIQSGKATSGYWVYRDHYTCDARCRYLNKAPTCTVIVSEPEPNLSLEES